MQNCTFCDNQNMCFPSMSWQVTRQLLSYLFVRSTPTITSNIDLSNFDTVKTMKTELMIWLKVVLFYT